MGNMCLRVPLFQKQALAKMIRELSTSESLMRQCKTFHDNICKICRVIMDLVRNSQGIALLKRSTSAIE